MLLGLFARNKTNNEILFFLEQSKLFYLSNKFVFQIQIFLQ